MISSKGLASCALGGSVQLTCALGTVAGHVADPQEPANPDLYLAKPTATAAQDRRLSFHV